MKDGKPCPKCGYNNIVPNQRVIDTNASNAGYTSGDFVVRLSEKPRALILKGEEHDYPLRVWICSQCGYAEWFVASPNELSSVYKRFQKIRRDQGLEANTGENEDLGKSKTFFVLAGLLGMVMLIALIGLVVLFVLLRKG